MRRDRTTRRNRTTIAFGTTLLGLVLVIAGSVTAPAAAHHNGQVAICHATSATTNPYVAQTVSSSSVDGIGNGDHYAEHTGPVWDASMPNNGGWGDIIPPLPGHHGGMNWDAAGQAIHRNGCVPPGSPPPPASTYVCIAASSVGETTATLNASTTDASATSATFTLNPGGIVLVDSTGGSPFSVSATGLTADTAYTYTVEFDPGDHQQSNAACAFTTDDVAPTPGAADLSASQECAAGGLRITVDNAGDADGVVDVLSDGVVVADDVTVPQGGSASIVVTVAEDAAYDIQVQGVASFTGTRDCVNVGGVVVPPAPTPGSAPAPAPAPTPTPTAGPATAPVVAPTLVSAPTVEGEAVARRELPRTGADATPLAQLGLGLVLLGAGAMVASRQEPTAA